MTKTDIANLALAKLGSESIRSIDDANVKGAEQAKLHYLPALKEILRGHFWSFALKTVSLDEITVSDAVAISPWVAAYALPVDFMKLKEIRTADSMRIDKFDLRRVENQRSLCTGVSDGIQIAYVALIDAPDDYDPLFVNAFVALLASKMARAIAGSENMESSLRSLYEGEYLPAARLADAQDSQSAENHPLKDFLNGALTGGPWE